MDASLLVDIAKLFQSRDRLAHPQIQRVEDWQLDEDAVEALNEQGRGAEVDYAMELSLKGLSGTQRVYEVVAAR